MLEIYEKIPLHELLETIESNLAGNIDSFYQQAKELIGKEKQHNLGFLKEQLKGQIETYLKTVIKNLIYYIDTYFGFKDTSTDKIKIIKNYLKEAIKNERKK